MNNNWQVVKEDERYVVLDNNSLFIVEYNISLLFFNNL